MSDALSKFISELQTLDVNNLAAPANQAALSKFQSLDPSSQRDIVNGLAAKHGGTFDELSSLSDADKARVSDNVKNNRATFDGVTRPQADKPKNFEQKWASSEATRTQPTGDDMLAKSNADFAKRHGEEAARSRHGYVHPAREKQLARIAEMQKQARVEGKSFSDIADARVRAGQ